MKLAKRYHGSVFSRAQLENLRSQLGLSDLRTSLQVAAEIQQTLELCNRFIKYRQKIASFKEAKRRLSRISTMSKQLAKLLATDDFAFSLLAIFSDEAERDNERSLQDLLTHTAMVDRANQSRLNDLIEDLKIISCNARTQAEDDITFRLTRGILNEVSLENADADIANRLLWPRLFDIWERFGGAVTATTNGPTFRFIELIHEVVELPPPSERTIWDVIRVWKIDKAERLR